MQEKRTITLIKIKNYFKKTINYTNLKTMTKQHNNKIKTIKTKSDNGHILKTILVAIAIV